MRSLMFGGMLRMVGFSLLCASWSSKLQFLDAISEEGTDGLWAFRWEVVPCGNWGSIARSLLLELLLGDKRVSWQGAGVEVRILLGVY